MKIILKIVWLLGVVVATSCYGAPYIGVENWSSWTVDGVQGVPISPDPNAPSVAHNVLNELKLTYVSDGTYIPPVVNLHSEVTGDRDYNNYVQNLTLQGFRLGIEFKLRTEQYNNTEPGNMILYFVGHGYTWTYSTSLSQPSLNSTTPFSFVIGSAANWVPSSGRDSTYFASDFNYVTSWGLSFIGSLDGPNIVYLDDFEIKVLVPEPETVWMMVMVLASLALTFRGRLTDLGNQVKARFAA